jgi:hypothetical protein
MTNTDGTKPAESGGDPLKEQNRLQLWLVFAFNSLFLYAVMRENAIRIEGLRALFSDAGNLLPAGFALVASIVLNGLLTNESKDSLVFLRWKYALPGHRAFSEHANADPRIDVRALRRLNGSELPTDPTDQNRLWYSIYLTIQDRPAVRQVHKSFLLLRDYTGLCSLFVIFYGGVGLYAIPSAKVGCLYLAILILQFVIVRHAACNYGISFVKTVLAQKAASP